TTRPAEVVSQAIARGISFYVVEFPLFIPQDGHLVARAPSKGFRDLAEKTGGQYFVAGDVKAALDPNRQYDLTPIFRAIAEDLSSQYLLGFYPQDATRDGRQHRITVNLSANDQKTRVRALRQEYVLAPETKSPR